MGTVVINYPENCISVKANIVCKHLDNFRYFKQTALNQKQFKSRVHAICVIFFSCFLLSFFYMLRCSEAF